MSSTVSVGSSRVALALDLLHESLPSVTNIPGKEWVPGPQLKYWGRGDGRGRVQFH